MYWLNLLCWFNSYKLITILAPIFSFWLADILLKSSFTQQSWNFTSTCGNCYEGYGLPVKLTIETGLLYHCFSKCNSSPVCPWFEVCKHTISIVLLRLTSNCLWEYLKFFHYMPDRFIWCIFSKLLQRRVVHVCDATLTKRLIEFENTESGGLTVFTLRRT